MTNEDKKGSMTLGLPNNDAPKRASFFFRKEIDIDSINHSNFHNVMKSRLMVPAEERNEDDIEILKTCTSYLKFFSNIMHVDPEDRLESHYNGCKYLSYRSQKKGAIVTKHRDNAEEFYITLAGRIAIFIPRNRQKIQDELDSIYWIRKKVGFGFDIKRYHLDKLAEEIGPKHGQNRHIRKFKIIKDRENRIVYRDDYFQEATKGLCVSNIPEGSGILTDDDVRI